MPSENAIGCSQYQDETFLKFYENPSTVFRNSIDREKDRQRKTNFTIATKHKLSLL